MGYCDWVGGLLGQQSHSQAPPQAKSRGALSPRTEVGFLADYPCDIHNSRYPGPSHRLYLNIYREDEEVKLKASVCEECLCLLVTEWLGHALHQAPAGNWDPPVDGEALDSLWRHSGERSRPLNGYRRV